jgi:hypothetical protein
MALRGTFTYAQLSANDANATNSARQQRGLRFTNTINELAVGLEYSYFEYNLSSYYQTFTPYILVELAAFNYKVALAETAPNTYQYGTKTSVAIPFGLGFKTKIARDFAMAFEIRTAYTFTDEIDYNNNEIPSLTFGNPNNNDWYTFTGISLVYAFGRPPCYATPY